MTNNNSNSDSSSDTPHGPSEDPDLSFASDSHMPFGPSGRDAFQSSNNDDDKAETDHAKWTPGPSSQDDSDEESPHQQSQAGEAKEIDPNDTWVPGEGSKGGPGAGLDANTTWVPPTSASANRPSQTDPPEIDPNKTWTPSGEKTTDGLPPEQVDDQDSEDPNLTWSPLNTPTVNGVPEDDEELDPNRTWTPSSTPTADGVIDTENDVEDEDADPFEKTWVAASPSTDADSSDTSANSDDPAEMSADKTWVPSSNPTADGVSPADEDCTGEPDGEDEMGLGGTWVMPERPDGSGLDHSDQVSNDEADRTWVPSATPTKSGSDQLPMPVDLTETVDLRAGSPPSVPTPEAGPAGLADTVELDRIKPDANDQLTAEGGDVFQKTIGMRRPLDSSDLPPSAMMDFEGQSTIHLDLPADSASQLDANATQLWSRQSGADLNQSLIIRSRPVAGDSHFESKADSADQPDYQIVEKIGEGGMGAIFLATQTSLDRQLAIKTLKAPRGGGRAASGSGRHSSSADRQRRDMFLAEALITANLVHPHIIPIHDLCETAEGLPFYSMKRVVGTPWCDRLREMELDENLSVLMKVCDAIAYAHHNGVVNRDLKPENVMLGEFGEVLVLDWGLAVPSSAADKKKFNSPSAPFGAGTPAYMAPELWTGPEEIIGYWSDIYLLGAILFELITGKAPHKFSEPSAKAGNTGLWMVIDKVVRRNDIRKTGHQGELMDIALKAMETRPKDRFESVLKFQEALKQFQAHEESRRLASRASETLQSAETLNSESGYLGYQSASALFEEAQAAWAENKEAAEGLKHTRLLYAGLAHKKGDFDLGLQIASLEDGPQFEEIRSKLVRSRRFRSALKSAVIAATAIIVAVGIFSFIQSREIKNQNRQIIALNGTRESLQTDIATAKNEIIEAEAKQKRADQNAIEAETRATAAAEEAEAAGVLAAAAEVKLSDANQKLDLADAKLSKATAKLDSANTTLKETERKVAELEVKKSRSAVDLKNAEISGLIRNGDYSNALAEVERLLSDLETSDEMGALPDSEKEQRETELQARRRQLLQRAVQLEVPVQSQVVSPSGTQIVWADQNGKLQVREVKKAGGVSTKITAETDFENAATAIAFSDIKNVILAADGSTVKVWDFNLNQTTELLGHQANVTKIQTSEDFAISADEQGSIRAWSLKTSEQLWSIRSSSQIVDFVLLPKDRIFIYAGSRGGESADILAYQLAGLAESNERPKRLGQLKFPRDKNDPPRALAVSPDGQQLLISNARNGSVLVLPKRVVKAGAGRDKFPFTHVTDLADTQNETKWLADRHQRPVNEISFSQDGTRFCTASDDRTIGVWKFDADGGPQLLQRLEGHGARVNAAAFVDQSGQQVVSISADRYCRFWNVDSYQTDKKKLEKTFQLSEAGMPKANLRLSENRPPRLQSPVRWSKLLAMPALLKPSLTFLTSLLAKDLQASTSEGSLDSRTFNVNPLIQRGAITSVVVSENGQLLTTGGSDGTAVIWDIPSGRPLNSVSATTSSANSEAAFDEGHDFNVSRFLFLPPHGKQLLTTGFDGNLCVWNADSDKAGTGHQTFRMPGLGLVNAIAASANGEYVIMSALSDDSSPGVCRLFRVADLLNADQPQPIAEFTGFHSSEISAVSIDAEGRQAVTGGRDGRVALWSCVDGRCLAAGRIHTKNTIVSYLKLLDNGRVLSAGYDGRLMLLKAKDALSENNKATTFDVIRRFVHDRIPIERVAVHPDQDKFVTISIRTEKTTSLVKYEMSLWDVRKPEAGRQLFPATVEGRPVVRVSSIDFSPDGSQLAAVVDQRIQVIDTSTWKVVRVVGAAGSGISDAIFSPVRDSNQTTQKIATFDGVAAHLWDLKSGVQLAAFRPLFSVSSLARSAHQRSLLLTGDRSIRFFQASALDKGFGRCVFKIEDPHSGVVNALEFNPNQPDVFASAGSDGSVCFWNWEQGETSAQLIRRVVLQDDAVNVVAVSWLSDGNHVWLASEQGSLNLINENGTVVVHCDLLKKANVEVADIAVRSDGRFLAVCGKDSDGGISAAWIFELRAADEHGAKELVLHCRLSGHEAGGIQAIQFVPNSPYLVTAGADGACLIWNWMPDRSEERPIEAYEAFQFLTLDGEVAHQAPINAISITDQGDVATVSDDGTAKLWRNPFVAPDIDK